MITVQPAKKVKFAAVPIWTLFRYRRATFLKLNDRYVLRLKRLKEPNKSERGVFRRWGVGKCRHNEWNPRGMRAGTLVELVNEK